MEFKPGQVTLVGGGPGDPDLITIGALKALQVADVVLYDNLAPKQALDYCRPEAQLIDVGKLPRGQFTPQDQINKMLVEFAKQNKIVVRFKGGDPFVFGRGGEEWVACLDNQVPVQIIPGVSSCVAAPASANIPVTHRGLSQGFTVVSGHVPPDDPRCQLNWMALAQTKTTLVILMGVKYLPQITQALIAGGMDPQTPAACIEDGTGKTQRKIQATVSTIAQKNLTENVTPPAVTVIGAVAGENLLKNNC